MDAFAVSICKGLGMRKVNKKQALVIGLFFGGFQALMPFVGWLLGSQFEKYITSIDHWIAFILLGIIGGKMIVESVKPDKEDDEVKEMDAPLDLKEMFVLAVATSIDALAVGITFAFLDYPIVEAITVIGITTFVISIGGVYVGNFFGNKYEKKAEFVGGLILVLLGVRILLTQARIAETEKYAHVTFFFNGGVEEPNKGEDRILVKSPKVATYDLKPEMSAYEVCDKLVDAIKADKYDVIVINFANPDMVGHTGVEAAVIKAIEAVDECVGKAVDAVKEVGGQMFICADHGNAEQLIDEETGEPFTAHTTNPVPFILVNADPAYKLREGGCLADIAPTLIELMGMQQPADMTGKSLLVK